MDLNWSKTLSWWASRLRDCEPVATWMCSVLALASLESYIFSCSCVFVEVNAENAS